MNSKDAIIEKIIADAKHTASEGLAVAETNFNAVIDKAKSEANQKLAIAKSQAQQLAKEISARKKTVAQLDVKKYLLGKKKAFLEEIFDAALKSVLASDDKTYVAMIAALIKKHASDGDKIIISKNDASRLTKKSIGDALGKSKIDLLFSDEPGDFEGGFILSNENCDKNLTLKLVLQSLRENIETKVADILFKE